MTTQKPKRARIQPAPALREPISQEWRAWGPYLSERQWGTVREDYSEFGEAWDSFPHDHARSRAYRWGEDGILGISDKDQLLCFGLALWNGADPILKERMFGLTGSQGNHGEDVKEYYYYLDASPTHSYLKGLYKYPQQAYPYNDLLETNRTRSRQEPEYELIDTGLFNEDRYFDVFVEYAKATPTDIVIRVSATNHGPDAASLDVLPTLWFRNTWSWGRDDRRPSLTNATAVDSTVQLVRAKHPELGDYWLSCEGSPELLFTENETNSERLFGGENRTPFVKDGINAAVVDGNLEAVNPDKTGTKVAARYRLDLGPGETRQIHLRLSARKQKSPFAGVDGILQSRIRECDALYENISQSTMTEDERRVQRQALAGMIWSKQFFYFHVDEWLEGDPAGPPPPEVRKQGRNSRWRLHRSHDIISMPDKWEYPWYAAWDLAFHCIPLALVDPEFAKDQLLLLTTERFMHPNGQLPAYEWAFGDVNPPVHIAAARALFRADQTHTGVADHDFLARLFHKLLINFTWWVNRKDEGDRNVFEGGFLRTRQYQCYRSQPDASARAVARTS